MPLQRTVRGVSLGTSGILLLTGLFAGLVLLFSDWWVWLRLFSLAPFLMTVLLQAPYQGQTAGAQLLHALRFYRTRATRQLKARRHLPSQTGQRAHRAAQDPPRRRDQTLLKLTPSSMQHPPPRPLWSGVVSPSPVSRDTVQHAAEVGRRGAAAFKQAAGSARGQVLRPLEGRAGPKERLPLREGFGPVDLESPWLL
jgi:hypothetical protein